VVKLKEKAGIAVMQLLEEGHLAHSSNDDNFH
jgi:hypothetical protein